MTDDPYYNQYPNHLPRLLKELKMTNYKDRTLTLSKHEVVVDRHHDITIVIEGGICVDVVGLPEEWGYIVQDNDMEKQG